MIIPPPQKKTHLGRMFFSIEFPKVDVADAMNQQPVLTIYHTALMRRIQFVNTIILFIASTASKNKNSILE